MSVATDIRQHLSEDLGRILAFGLALCEFAGQYYDRFSTYPYMTWESISIDVSTLFVKESHQHPLSYFSSFSEVASGMGRLLFELLENRPYSDADLTGVVGTRYPISVYLVLEKLLSKSLSDTYQRIEGLRSDLMRMHDHWQKSGDIAYFFPGESDSPPLLKFRNELLGRDDLLASLVARLAARRPGLILIHGEAGIGKSSLVRSLLSAIPETVTVLEAKADPFSKSPYGPIGQLIGHLVDTYFRDKDRDWWHRHVDQNFKYLAPILSQIHPYFAALSPDDAPTLRVDMERARNRLLYAVQFLFSTLARLTGHLLLVIDDAHWYNDESIMLLWDLCDGLHFSSSIFITYRSEEGGGHRVFQDFIKAQQSAGRVVDNLALDGLAEQDLSAWLTGLLHLDAAGASIVARWLYEKTKGNPFYVKELLNRAVDQEVFTLSSGGQWHWDIDVLEGFQVGENVAKLTASAMQGLSQDDRDLLFMASLLNQPVDIGFMARILQAEIWALSARIWHLHHQKFLICDAKTQRFGFAHDVVKQAAHGLAAEDAVVAAHLRIARFLSQSDDDAVSIMDAAVFYNRSERGDMSDDDIEMAVRANQVAATYHYDGAAYASALHHFQQILFWQGWQKKPDEAHGFDNAFKLASCQHFLGDYKAALQGFEALLATGLTLDRQLQIWIRQMELLTMTQKFDEAIASGQRGLALLGHNPSSYSKLGLMIRTFLALIKFRGSYVRSLPYKPVLDDDYAAVLSDLLVAMLAPMYYADLEGFLSTLLKSTTLVAKRGRSRYSENGLMTLAVLLTLLGRYKQAKQLADVSLVMQEQSDDDTYSAKILSTYASFVLHWHRDYGYCRKILQKAMSIGAQTGDFHFASISAAHIFQTYLCGGTPLADVVKVSIPLLQFTATHRLTDMHNVLQTQALFATFMDPRFKVEAGLALSGIQDIAQFENANIRSIAALLLFMRHFYLDEVAQLRQGFEVYLSLYEKSKGLTQDPDYLFYGALTNLIHRFPIPFKYRQFKPASVTKLFKTLAVLSPDNFYSKSRLLMALRAQRKGRFHEAERFFKQAIDYSGSNPMFHVKGLACDLFGDQDGAIAFYEQWGAGAVLARLT